MSPDSQMNTSAALVHERARNLAADAIDVTLSPSDAEWLSSHLDSCAECKEISDEYQSIHLELGSLELPEPPRDLWARTSAAFDAIDASAGRGPARRTPVQRAGRRPLFGTVAAVGVVAVAAAASLMIQGPLSGPQPGTTSIVPIAAGSATAGAPGESPVAPSVVGGYSFWVSADAGTYQIKGSTTQCTLADGTCLVTDGTAQTLGSISSDSSVSAVIAPNAETAAVWSADKVAILPLSTQPKTVALADLTPRPTSAATETAKVVATSTATATATSSALASAVASSTPVITAPPSTDTTINAQATAILSGYEIVGRDPEFSPDGQMVAFSARPVDHLTEPQVFIWRTGTEQARPITFEHTGLFAGWFGQQVLVSEISSGSSDAATTGITSFVYNTATSSMKRINRPMLMPSVDPTGQYLVYWSGSVEFDPATGWQPGKGDLYFDAWSNLTLQTVASSATPSPTPLPSAAPSAAASDAVASPAAPAQSATVTPSESPTEEPTLAPTAKPTPAGTLPQMLQIVSTPASVHGWTVRWDGAGRNVAVWVANPGSSRIGRLGLYGVDRTAALVNINEPRLAADKVLSGIQFDGGSLVYTSAFDGKTYMQAVPAVPPSNADTPSPTVPGKVAGSPAATPATTDRPGN